MKFFIAPLAATVVAVFAAASSAQAAGPMSFAAAKPVISTAIEAVQYRARGTRCRTRVGICPLNISGSKPLGAPCNCKFPSLKARASGHTVR